MRYCLKFFLVVLLSLASVSCKFSESFEPLSSTDAAASGGGLSHHLSFVIQPPPSANAGIPVMAQPAVSILDKFNKLVNSADAEITLTLHLDSQCLTPEVKLTAGSFPAVANAKSNTIGGMSTFKNFQINLAGKTVYIKASSANLDSTCSTLPITILPGPPIEINSSASAFPNSNVTADGETKSTLTFLLKDLFGNPVTNKSVEFSVSSTNNILSNSSPVVTDDNGKVTVQLASTIPGVKVISVTQPLQLSTSIAFQLNGCLNPIWVQGSYTGGLSDGSYLKPYPNVFGSNSAFAATTDGACILIRGGTYDLSAGATVSGKNNIRFFGVKGEAVILSGFTRIPTANWSVYQDLGGNLKIYKAIVPKRLHKVALGYKWIDVAHFPAEGWLSIPAGFSNDSLADTSTFTDSRLIGLTDLATATVMAYNSTSKITAGYLIKSFNTSTGDVTTKNINLTADDRYLLTNTLGTIQKGQWALTHINGTNNYNLFYMTSDPSELEKIGYPRDGGALVTVSGSGHIFKNLIFVGGTMGLNLASSDTLVEGNIFALNTNVFQTGNGLNIRPNGGSVPDRTVIKGNLIFNNNTGMAAGNAQIASTIDDLQFLENEIFLNEGDGFDLSGSTSNVLVKRNYIHNHFHSVVHADGFQTWGETSGGVAGTGKVTNLTLEENFFHMNGQNYYTQQDNIGIIFKGNILSESAASSMLAYAQAGSDYNFSNNTSLFPNLEHQFKYANFNFLDNVFSSPNNRLFTKSNYYPQTAIVGSNFNLYLSTCLGCNIFANVSYDSNQILISWHNFSGLNSLTNYSNETLLEANSALKIGAFPFANMPIASSPLSTTTSHFLQNTKNSVVLFNGYGFNVGDKIEFNGDGVARQISAVNAVTGNPTSALKIEFSPPLPMIPFSTNLIVSSWGSSPVNFQRSAAIIDPAYQNISSTGELPGSDISILQYQNGDLSKAGKRTLPVVPAEIAQAIPDSLSWTIHLIADPKP